MLVTGHSGFSGTWLCHLLTSQGAEVLGYSRDRSSFSTIFADEELSKQFLTVYGKVEDASDLTQHVEQFQPHLVIHLAAQSLVLEGYRNPMETIRTNALGTAQVLESSLVSKVLKGVLAITTDKVYSESSLVKHEDSKLGGSDPYSCSKVAAEEVVKAFRPSYSASGVSLTVARGGNIIGGGDWSKDRLVPDLIRAHWNGESLTLRNPHSIRPWQHVLDLVSAYSLIARNMLAEPGPASSTEFNVGPNLLSSVSVRELAFLFAENGFPVEVSIQPGTKHEAQSLAIDSGKIESHLGWRPLIPISLAVRLTAEWYSGVLRDKLNPHEVTRKQILEYMQHD